MRVLTGWAGFGRVQISVSRRSEWSEGKLVKAVSKVNCLVKSRKESRCFWEWNSSEQSLSFGEEDDEEWVIFWNKFLPSIYCILISFEEYQKVFSVKSKKDRNVSPYGGTLEIGKLEKVPTCVTYSRDWCALTGVAKKFNGQVPMSESQIL